MKESTRYALLFVTCLIGTAAEALFIDMYDPVTEAVNALQLGIGAGEREYAVALKRSSFRVDAQVGTMTVNMMVDTGSSVVMLSKSTARELGYRVDKLNYDTVFLGVGGTIHAAQVLLPPIQLGGILVEDLDGYVADDTGTTNNLLGIPFLTKLKRVEISEKRLRLVQ